MTTWAQVIDGVVLNPVTVDPATCFTTAWLQGKTFVVVSDTDKNGEKLRHGATLINGEYTNPSSAQSWKIGPTISRPRFDAVFAAGCGEAYFENALRALAVIGNTNPATDQTAPIARALKALNNPPKDGIDFPLTKDWATSPDPKDLTGSLLRGIKLALQNVNGFNDIGAKIDASLAIWAELSA